MPDFCLFSRGKTQATSPRFISVGLACSSPSQPGRINKLAIFSCYYVSGLSPSGIRITLLWNLGNSILSIYSVVQVGSCAMLERQKKKVNCTETITHQYIL
jgi:hypothetical protein